MLTMKSVQTAASSADTRRLTPHWGTIRLVKIGANAAVTSVPGQA
jgi:hypothetical protein